MTAYTKREMIFTGILFLGMMILGSFFDLEISQTLIDPQSPFGIAFGAFGEWPYEFALVLGGLCLIFGGTPEKKADFIIRIVVGGLIVILSAAFAAQVPVDYFPAYRSLFLPLSIILTILITGLLVLFVRKCDRRRLTKAGLMILLVGFGEVLLIILLKEIWGRPRMGFLMGTPAVEFQPWWVIQSSAQEAALALGVAAENFKSFPSGHVGNAACMMILGMFPYLRPGWKKWGSESSTDIPA